MGQLDSYGIRKVTVGGDVIIITLLVHSPHATIAILEQKWNFIEGGHV